MSEKRDGKTPDVGNPARSAPAWWLEFVHKRPQYNWWERDGKTPVEILCEDLGDDIDRWLDFVKHEPDLAYKLLAGHLELIQKFPLGGLIELYKLSRSVNADVEKATEDVIRSRFETDAPRKTCDEEFPKLPSDFPGRKDFPVHSRSERKRAEEERKKVWGTRWLIPVLVAVAMCIVTGSWIWWACGSNGGNCARLSLTWLPGGLLPAIIAFMLVCTLEFRLVFVPRPWVGALLTVGSFSLPLLLLVVARCYLWAWGVMICWGIVFAIVLAVLKKQFFWTPPFRGWFPYLMIVLLLFFTLAPFYFFHHYPAFPWGRKSRDHGDYDRMMSVECRQCGYLPKLCEAYTKAWRVSNDYAARQNALLKALDKASDRRWDELEKKGNWDELEKKEKEFADLDPGADAPWYVAMKKRFDEILKRNSEDKDHYAAFRKHGVLREEYGKSIRRSPEEAVERRWYGNWLDRALDDILRSQGADPERQIRRAMEISDKVKSLFPDMMEKPEPKEKLKAVFTELLRRNAEADDYYTAFRRHDVLKAKYGKFFGRPDEASERGWYETWLNRALDEILKSGPADLHRQIECAMEISAKTKSLFPDVVENPGQEAKRRKIFAELLTRNGRSTDYYAASLRHDELRKRYDKFFGKPDEKIERDCYVGWVNGALDEIRNASKADKKTYNKKLYNFWIISNKAKNAFPDLMENSYSKEKEVFEEKVKAAVTRGGSEQWEDLHPRLLEAFENRDYVNFALYERGHKASDIPAHEEKYLVRLELWEPQTAERLIRCAELRRERGAADKEKMFADLKAACEMGSLKAMRLYIQWGAESDPRVREYLQKLYRTRQADVSEVLRLARASFRYGDWATAGECYGAVPSSVLTAADRHDRAVVFRKLDDAKHEFDELSAALLAGYDRSLSEDLDRCCELGRQSKRMDDLYEFLRSLAARGCVAAYGKYIDCAYELKRVDPVLWRKFHRYFTGSPRSRYRFVSVGRAILSPEKFYDECESAIKAKCDNWEKLAEEAALFASAKKQYARAVGFFREIPKIANEKYLSEYARALWETSDISDEAVEVYVEAIRSGRNYELAMALGDKFGSRDRVAAIYVWDLAIESVDDPRAKGMAADKIVEVIFGGNEMSDSGKYSFREAARNCCKEYRGAKRFDRLKLAFDAGGYQAVQCISKAYRYDGKDDDLFPEKPEIRKRFPDLNQCLKKIDEMLVSGRFDDPKYATEKEKLTKWRNRIQGRITNGKSPGNAAE